MATTNVPMTILSSTKFICNVFFGPKPIDEEHKRWRCTCGAVRKCDVSKNGYANLMTHIKSKHPEYESLIKTYSTESINTPLQITRQPKFNLKFMVDTKSNDVFKWLDWIVMDE